jgi:hypothetical protein
MGEIADLIRKKNPHNIAGFFRKATVTQEDDGTCTVTEERDEYENVHGIWVPEGTVMLEPRHFYDPALIGVAHQAGTNIAVYSKKEVLRILIEDASTEEMEEDEDPETSAIEHYEFNVSGTIGIGLPVFMIDDEDE